MTMHRVAVTGLGAITPLGIGAERFWDATLARKVATRRITRFDPSHLDSQVAAQIDDFDPSNHMDERRVRRTDRFAQLAIAATQLAFDDAALRVNGDGEEFGIYIGSALSGVAYGEEQHDRYQAEGIGAVRPLLATSVFGGASTCTVAMHFGLQGPNIANG
ncbi:MAG TPA: beta-ketoacyl synthase N-terminal-like domain-containing protein, partial [Candidatus Baltobacteraceae bacterium]